MMRVLVDLKSHLAGNPKVVQVKRDPPKGAQGRDVVNGRYVISLPQIPIGMGDVILDEGEITTASIVSKGFAALLAQHPQYRRIYFNPLLTADHLATINSSGSFATSEGTFTPRYQAGRPDGVEAGQMPGHTALLPINSTVTPARPGLLITHEIDLSAEAVDCEGDVIGARQFAVYWKVYKYTVTEDIAADVGKHAGKNEPALRLIEEPDGLVGFSAYLSTNGGSSWCRASLLQPVTFCDPATKIVLAFRNDSSDKLYLGSFAVLF